MIWMQQVVLCRCALVPRLPTTSKHVHGKLESPTRIFLHHLYMHFFRQDGRIDGTYYGAPISVLRDDNYGVPGSVRWAAPGSVTRPTYHDGRLSVPWYHHPDFYKEGMWPTSVMCHRLRSM